jgi:DNA end-binding protein Ku
VPPKGSERAYALLREAMRAAGLVGIATIVLRDAQHLAALEVVGKAIVLTQMRYPEELVDASIYTFPETKDLRKPELEIAKTLVEHLADRGQPGQYTDRYCENLMRIIRARQKGKQPKLVEEAEPRQAEVVDLMERLRRPLEASGGAARKSVRARKTAARSRRTRAA